MVKKRFLGCIEGRHSALKGGALCLKWGLTEGLHTIFLHNYCKKIQPIACDDV